MPTTEQLNSALDGRYTIERHIGEGGMATVYLARDVKHNRKVALKVLKPDLGAIVGVERFLSEIEVTANLQHPNLLPLFDSGAAGDVLFYVMPYVEGESLRARLNREKQLPVDEAVRIAAAVASALDYAHRHQVIHRDLKPENILMHDGQPLVADFGIALAVSNAGGNRITQTGLSLGTPQYMSPEQATGDRLIDARTDIYSLGAVLYEMLTGEAPHTGATSQAIIARVLTEKPRSIRATRASVPAHVQAAVEQAIEKLPADRWASAKEFSEALTGARAVTLPAAAAAQPANEAAAPRHRGVARVREAAAWGLAAAGLATAAYFSTRSAPEFVPFRFVVELPETVTVATSSAQTLALSPDGTQLALLGEKRGTRQIYLRLADDPVAQPVRGTDGALYHAFSSDGKSLVFVTGNSLKTVPVTGGTPQTLADSVQLLSAASWGASGRVLYVFRNSLYAVSSDGGQRTLVAKPDSANGILTFQAPYLLPDGAHALVSTWGSGGLDSARISVVSLDDGKVVDLGLRGTKPYYASGHITFAKNGGLVFAAPFSLGSRSVTGPQLLLLEQVRQATTGPVGYSVAQNGTIAYESSLAGANQTMYVVDRQGTERELKSAPQPFKEPRLSPDGRRIAVRIGASNTDGGLWIYDIAPGTLRRLTPDSASIRGQWSRDGSRIIYPDHSESDTQHVASRPWDGSGPAVVLARGPRFAFQEVSLGIAKGWSAIRSGTDGGMDIFIAPAESLLVRRPFLNGPADEYTPRVSPNGRLLAYTSRETGQDQVYVTPIPGPGPRVQVSVYAGTEPAWSSDGATLFYRGPTRMMAATIAERPALAVARQDSLFLDVYRRYRQHTAYDVFPNGREFLMTRGPDTRSTLYVIVNWPHLARVRTAAGR